MRSLIGKVTLTFFRATTEIEACFRGRRGRGYEPGVSYLTCSEHSGLESALIL